VENFGNPEYNLVFSGVEKEVLEKRYKSDQLNDMNSREDVNVLYQVTVNRCQKNR
jgi:hypothetical protein